MTIKHLILLFLLVTGLLHGCKTTGLTKSSQEAEAKTEAETEKVKQEAFEIKEYFLPAESWEVHDDEAVKTKIREASQEAADEGRNTLFLEPGNLPATGFDALEYTLEEANKNKLKLFVVIDPLELPPGSQDLPFHELKKTVREKAGTYVLDYNIDGLGLILPERPDKGDPVNDTVAGDLFEDVLVWARLHKPYLYSSIIKTVEGKPTLNNNKAEQVLPEKVMGLNFSDYFEGSAAGKEIYLADEGRAKIIDADGFIGFISSSADTIRLRTPEGEVCLSIRGWNIPYEYAVLPDNTVTRKKPWVEFRRMPQAYTNDQDYDLLCKTDYPATVSINGQELKQYKTGIFFSTIRLEEGPNRIRATVITKDSLSTFYEQEYYYEEVDRTREPFPLWIDEKSLEPFYDLELLPGDILRVSFSGSLGQEASIRFHPGNYTTGCSREDFEDYSIYRADVPVSKFSSGERYSFTLQLGELAGASGKQGHRPYKLAPDRYLTVREPEAFPMVMVRNENTRLTYNLGAPRLGGPLRAELGPGVIFRTNGSFGDYYRVHLSNVEHGYLHKEDVEILPAGTIKPSYYITSMSCAPSENADVLSIPYPEALPWEVHPDPAGKRISVHLYGVQTSSTWVSHYDGLKIIDRITWEQATPETYKVHINLKTSEIWGYDCRVENERLVLRIKYPPVFNASAERPLSGLKIAIEAGHGGSNTGAVGLSGLLEKDINLDLSFRLGELCRQMGAEVVQVRESDIDIPLIEKRDKAIDSGADMLISIHANAGGRGYLSVDGTSTYWHNPFWAPLAEDIYRRLLELDLDEFGVVGSFNYTVTRMSQMPAVLVEQAFMSHAEDEEKLADPEFRQQMAEKICQGIVDYLKNISEGK